MYHKICLIGPQRHQMDMQQVTDALDHLLAHDEVACILVGSLTTPLAIAGAEFANENGIALESIEPKHDDHGPEAYTRQMWDFIAAKTDLFIIFPPFDVNTHNAQVLATYAGCAQWVPYDG